VSTDPSGPEDVGTSTFELLPAIDLRAGRAVRLTLGDFERETVYDDDPVAVAARFVAAGARWIHVVDLDGARAGEPRQADIVGAIVAAVGDRAACQVAGGLRDEGAVARALEAGAGRVVLGTAALRDPEFVGTLIERFGPHRIVVALDVRDGLALGEGWRSGVAGLHPEEALLTLSEAGAERFAVTAIERDGALLGPDLDLVGRLVALGRGSIIASAGIRSVDDLLAVRRAGAAGAIVGKALYEGRIDLATALGALATGR
jgi:phosphoribosylformimino-5-aminoimidazole carboxamide ribotide isomerase